VVKGLQAIAAAKANVSQKLTDSALRGPGYNYREILLSRYLGFVKEKSQRVTTQIGGIEVSVDGRDPRFGHPLQRSVRVPEDPWARVCLGARGLRN
jgi:hypothetical protein